MEHIAGYRPSRRQFLATAAATAAGVVLAPISGLGQPGPELAAGTAAAAAFVVPGEDTRLRRTWMAWPSSTEVWGRWLLPRIQRDVALVARTIARDNAVVMCATNAAEAGVARKQCGPLVTVISSVPVDDCWMRDTGPLFRTDDLGGLDAFGLNFNGWGKKQIHGKDDDVAKRVAGHTDAAGFAKASVVGEGGGIEYDGDGTLIANESSWVNPNRNPGLTRDQIEVELLSRFGATKMIWCQGLVGEDITDAHIDGVARFVRPGVVMVQLAPPGRTDVWAQEAQEAYDTLSTATDAQGRSLQVLTIEGPDTLPRWPVNHWDTFFDGYVNWVVTNRSIITVQFGDSAKDAAAKAAIEVAFPDKQVIQLNLDRLHGWGGGGAHCITMQEPRA